MTRVLLVYFMIILNGYNQSLNLNNPFFENNLRIAQLNGEFSSEVSFTLRPIDFNNYFIDRSIFDYEKYSREIFSFFNDKGKLRILPVDYNINYTTHHPYNRNNGSMIPNRGYQQLISWGFYFELGPLSIQFKPENIYAENKEFDGFWEGHEDITWARRYLMWNKIDMPERFGESAYKKTFIGQSNIRLNYKSLSLGLSSENIWWGPSIRNGSMLSNNARGFNHITFNTRKPIKTKIGNLEFQFVTGRLEPSGFNPPNADRLYAGTKLFVPKTNRKKELNDWRFFQGYSLTFSPKFIKNFHIGLNRWTQMYGAMFENRYNWLIDATGKRIGWFPIFNNFLRKNDSFQQYERDTDQAAGIFFRWVWQDSKAEIYGEFNYSDSKFNLRDLLTDSDHARAVTLGIHKLFDSKDKKSQIEFLWEWTQLEATASKVVRKITPWYAHNNVRHGFTNFGEVMGAGIGPGSNSQYFSLSRIKNKERIGIAFEIIDNDNDFYYEAFNDSGDFRRYWKDINLHLYFHKEFNKFWGSFNLVFSRSLNYQWELLLNPSLPYYRPGRDVNNLHLDMKLTFPFLIKK